MTRLSNTKNHPFSIEDWIGLAMIPLLAALILFIHHLNFDYTEFLKSQAGTIESHTLVSANIQGRWLDRGYQIRSTRGYHFNIRIRRPANLESRQQVPALIILGGIETGSRSIQLINTNSNLMLVGVDYAYKGKTRYSNLEFLFDLPIISAAIAESFGAVLLTTGFIHTFPEVDTNRVVMIGSSFGVPYSVIATALDSRIDGLVNTHGGGHLVDMVLQQIPDDLQYLSPFLWPVAAYLLAPYEPLNYIHLVSPRPFLLINATRDERIPYDSMIALFQMAREPKDIVWMDSKHILPSRKELINNILNVAEIWLVEKNLLD